jgi:hypothetical protein
MNEERMEQLARRLGARAAEQVDVDTVARQVVERLRAQPVSRATWIQPAWLRMAATVVVLLGGGVLIGRLIPGRGPGTSNHAAHYVADDLNDLSAAELRDVLASFDDILNTDSVAVPDTTDWRELDAQQLREVLRALEGEG